MLDPETLAWAKANFTFTIDGPAHTLRPPFVIAFIERDSHCVLDWIYSKATSDKQLKYEVNEFMLELEKVL